MAEATQPTEGGDLPDEILEMPVFQALMAGSPAAVSADIKSVEKTPLGQAVKKHGQALQGAGFAFYRSQDGNLGVMFNQLRITPDEITQADQGGQLQDVAPPYESVEAALIEDPGSNPVLSADAPGGPPTAQARQLPQVGGAPATGKAQRQIASDRTRNIQRKSPTSGPNPGAGNVLRDILKPVV